MTCVAVTANLTLEIGGQRPVKLRNVDREVAGG
jgi:hypothetical protein